MDPGHFDGADKYRQQSYRYDPGSPNQPAQSPSTASPVKVKDPRWQLTSDSAGTTKAISVASSSTSPLAASTASHEQTASSSITNYSWTKVGDNWEKKARLDGAGAMDKARNTAISKGLGQIVNNFKIEWDEKHFEVSYSTKSNQTKYFSNDVSFDGLLPDEIENKKYEIQNKIQLLVNDFEASELNRIKNEGDKNYVAIKDFADIDKINDRFPNIKCDEKTRVKLHQEEVMVKNQNELSDKLNSLEGKLEKLTELFTKRLVKDGHPRANEMNGLREQLAVAKAKVESYEKAKAAGGLKSGYSNIEVPDNNEIPRLQHKIKELQNNILDNSTDPVYKKTKDAFSNLENALTKAKSELDQIKDKGIPSARVHANTITLGDTHFIAAQIPKENLSLIKSLIVEQNVHDIACLTSDAEVSNLNNEERLLGLNYFPRSAGEDNPHFEFQSRSDDSSGLFTTYTLKVKDANPGHIVRIHQYNSWPDFGVVTPNQLDQFVSHVKANRSEDGPLLVQCNASVGRTGVFIGAYTVNETGRTDTTQILNEMREQRSGLIQEPEQFVLLDEFAKLQQKEINKLREEAPVLSESQFNLHKSLLSRNQHFFYRESDGGPLKVMLKSGVLQVDKEGTLVDLEISNRQDLEQANKILAERKLMNRLNDLNSTLKEKELFKIQYLI